MIKSNTVSRVHIITICDGYIFGGNQSHTIPLIGDNFIGVQVIVPKIFFLMVILANSN